MDPHPPHHRSKADLSMTSLTSTTTPPPPPPPLPPLPPPPSLPPPTTAITTSTSTSNTHTSPPHSLPPPLSHSLSYSSYQGQQQQQQQQQQQSYYRQPSPSTHPTLPPVYHNPYSTSSQPRHSPVSDYRPPSHHSQSPVPAEAQLRQPHNPTQQFDHHYRAQQLQRSPSIGSQYQPTQSPQQGKMALPYQFQQTGYTGQSPPQQQSQSQFPAPSPTGNAQNNYFLHHSTLPRPSATSPVQAQTPATPQPQAQSKPPPPLQIAQPQPRLPPTAPSNATVIVPPKQPSPAPLPVNQIPPGGAPARRYLNENVTPVLLEGMKMLAREQPKEPLLALARFLEDMHKEGLESRRVKLEGSNGSG